MVKEWLISHSLEAILHCLEGFDSHLVNKVLHHNGGFAVVAAIAKVFLVVRLVLDAAKIAHAVDRVRFIVSFIVSLGSMAELYSRRGEEVIPARVDVQLILALESMVLEEAEGAHGVVVVSAEGVAVLALVAVLHVVVASLPVGSRADEKVASEAVLLLVV
jgi:hypothetical protein